MALYTKIAGTGSYLPAEILTNQDLAQRVETSHAWIFERTGIEQRHIAAKEDTTSSMAEQAARQAIAAAGISPGDIDLIIVATTTPDKILPSTACLLQQKLGINNHCPAFDIVAACTGFIYGLSIADQYIKSGAAKNILLVASEIMSRIVDWEDRRTCVLFGDGAGAVILQPSQSAGVLSTHLHASGIHEDLLWVPSALPAQCEGNQPHINMKGSELFKLAVNSLSNAVDEVLDANHITSKEINWLIPHQANLRIIQAIAKKLNLPWEKVILTIQDHGNTSAASVPLAMHRAILDGRIKRGDTLLLEAFGAGLTWGSALVVY